MARQREHPMKALKAAWEVRAGIIPGVEMPEYFRRWTLASYDFESLGENEKGEVYSRLADEASAYAREIQSPKHVNWVKLEFLWL
jgi:hypothetical protein